MYFTEYFGMIGVAFSVLFTNIIKAYFTNYFSQKHYKINWDFSPIILIILITMISCGISNFIWTISVVFIKLMLEIITLLIILSLGWKTLIDKNDKIYVMQILKKKLHF